MNKKLWLPILIIIIIVVGVLIYTSQKRGEEKEVIKIGAILDLTGPAVNECTKIKDGMNLALEEVNMMGGIDDKKLEIVWEDDKCDAKEGISAFHQMNSLYDFPVIIGGSCSPVTLALAPLAEEDKFVLISPASSNPGISQAGDYIFRTVPSDIFEANLEAEFVIKDLAFKKVGVLYVNNDYGKGLADAFSSRFEELGGDVLIKETYLLNAADFRSQLTKIKNLNPELIYLAGYQKELINILKQAKELGISSQLLSISLMEAPEVIQEASDAAEGVILSSIFFDPDKVFSNKFQEKYGNQTGTWEAVGYDALMLVAQAIEQGGYNADGIKNALYEIEYDGALGHLTFDENGDIVWPKLTMKIVKDGEFVPYFPEE